MCETSSSYLFPLDLGLFVRMHFTIAVGTCSQHVVLDLQQPQLRDVAEELVGRAGDLLRGGEMDVAVIAVEV